MPADAVRVSNSFFQCSDEQKKIVDEFGMSIVHAGVYLGALKGKDFTPSVAFVESLPFPKVVVDKKQAWLFLCGRDVFMQYHTDSEFVLICDEKETILGIAKPDRRQLTNVWDKGSLLRREMNNPKKKEIRKR